MNLPIVNLISILFQDELATEIIPQNEQSI
jgi:hypothetical protein